MFSNADHNLENPLCFSPFNTQPYFDTAMKMFLNSSDTHLFIYDFRTEAGTAAARYVILRLIIYKYLLKTSYSPN